MVKKEQDPQYDTKWESDAHPFTIEFPKCDKPFSSIRSLESATYWESGRVGGSKTSPKRHARSRDERYRHAIVLKEDTDSPMKISSLRECLKEEGGHQHEECQYDSDERAIGSSAELTSDNLYAVLKVDPRHIKTEGIAGEEGHIFQKVAPCVFCMRRYVETGSPDSQLSVAVIQWMMAAQKYTQPTNQR